MTPWRRFCAHSSFRFIFSQQFLKGCIAWGALVFAAYLMFQRNITNSIQLVNAPVQYTFRSVITPDVLITVNIVPPEDMPPDVLRDFYIASSDTESNKAMAQIRKAVSAEETRAKGQRVILD
jgi:hypothetical protein